MTELRLDTDMHKIRRFMFTFPAGTTLTGNRIMVNARDRDHAIGIFAASRYHLHGSLPDSGVPLAAVLRRDRSDRAPEAADRRPDRSADGHADQLAAAR